MWVGGILSDGGRPRCVGRDGMAKGGRGLRQWWGGGYRVGRPWWCEGAERAVLTMKAVVSGGLTSGSGICGGHRGGLRRAQG